MCGILGIFNLNSHEDPTALRARAVELSQRQRHRGPDWSGVYIDERAVLIHERLSIIDVVGGDQPLRSVDGSQALIVNGEIYNHQDLKMQMAMSYCFRTGSDCEVINALYDKEGDPTSWLNRINGIFAFALWDRETGRVVIARDPMGVCPLYWGRDVDERLYVASEMKVLADTCPDVAQFPPGCYYDSVNDNISRYYTPEWREYSRTEGVSVSESELRVTLERAVQRQLMSEVPYGVLLSGGLDSSLVSVCTAKWIDRAKAEKPREVSRSQLHSFSIGLEGSPDLNAAAIVAREIGGIHHAFCYTLDEGLDALPEVIRHIESYDVTTVRASAPMYLLARRIKAMGVKMVLSGEGADELFGGYLYFHKAPSPQEFHAETLRKLDALHSYDCLRANKAMMAWGVEVRVPFLDVEFIEVAMKMDAKFKMAWNGRIEKAVLREAFEGYLPKSILWRQKEQFSDGVGYGWIDGLKSFAGREISDSRMANAASRFPLNTPATKEAYLYRSLFERHFPGPACAQTVPAGKSIACSSPAAIAWDVAFENSADPSGRSMVDIHKAANRLYSPDRNNSVEVA